jgi:Initiation factor 2 subunit family
MEEETSLTPASLVLFRQGKPYSFHGPSVGREWTIYPFGFRLKNPAEGGHGEEAIWINWEHEAWAWHDPDAVIDESHFAGVPRLKDSLRPVWYESDLGDRASQVLAARLDRLRDDHESGSRELAAFAIGVFRSVITALEGEAIDAVWWEKVRVAAWHLWKGRESMSSPILNVLLTALLEIEPVVVDRSETVARQSRVICVLDHLIEERQSTMARVCEAFSSYLHENFVSQRDPASPVTVLTLSASSTIRECIVPAAIASKVRALDVRVLESRPRYEGVRLAASLWSQL